MITRSYCLFSDAYSELAERSFSVCEMDKNRLIARYLGKNPIREKDSNLEIIIAYESGRWVLNADEKLYCNRVLFNLSPETEGSYENIGGSRINHPIKRLEIISLKNGILQPISIFEVNYPYWAHWRGILQVDFNIAKDRIKEYEKKGFEISFTGFSKEDFTAFEVTNQKNNS